jgi:hypothetical protein
MSKLGRVRDPDLEHSLVRRNDCWLGWNPMSLPRKGRPSYHQWRCKNAKRIVNRRTDFEVDPGFAKGLTEVFEGIKIWGNRKKLKMIASWLQLTRCDTRIRLASCQRNFVGMS